MMRPRTAAQRFFLALSLICIAPAAWGDYDPISLCDLVGASDVIASGEIIEVGDKTFIFGVDEVFAGNVAPGDRLEIQKFQDWACAARWADYQAKERLFLFLAVAEVDGKKELYALGAGDEGEMPIVIGEVYVRPYGIGGDSIEYGTSQRGPGSFVKIPYHIFRDSIAGFRKCFKLEVARDRLPGDKIPACFSSIRQLCGDDAVAAFSSACGLNRRLVGDLKDEYRLTVRRYGPQQAAALDAK